MSSKTNTDLIRELGVNFAVLGEQVDQLKAKLEACGATQAKSDDFLVDARTRLAVLESKVSDLKAVQDEKDRRRWTIWLAVLGSFLALAVNVALIFLKR